MSCAGYFADQVAKEQEIKRLGVRSLVVMGDASDLAIVDQMRARAEKEFGGVDIYVSNAARRLYKDFFETTNEDWHYYLNQQLTASWYLAKAFVPGMRDRGWGRVVHINDVSPGFTETKRDPKTHPEVTQERTDEFLPSIPIRRQPTPEELAWAVAFLCSTRSAAITGMVIHVTGGEWMFG